MKKKKMNYITIYIVCALMILLLFGVVVYAVMRGMDKNGKNKNTPSQPSTVWEAADKETEFLILRNDSIQEELYVYSYEDCEEYRYRYNLSTEFEDAYGNHASIGRFTTGRVVKLFLNSNNRELSKVQFSDDVWEYTDISRYSFDENMQMMIVGTERYSIKDAVFFSDENQITLQDITDKDKLMIIGKDKTIVSVVITTGHGILSVTNSSEEVDFDGGYIQVGDRLFAKINGDMEIEVPEGTYPVAAVSPDGYGDSVEITIKRGSTVELDLATLQGEGPKKGAITFIVDESTAKVRVDNREVDISSPVELTYGLHSFVIVSDTYENYARYLFVNSPKARVSVNLASVGVLKGQNQQNTTQTEETSTTESETTTQSSQKETQGGNSVPSTSELIEQEKNKLNPTTGTANGTSGSSQSSNSSNQAEEDYLKGILSTLGSILGQ